MKLPNHVSESVKARNPHLFTVGGLATTVRESGAEPALVKKPQARQSGSRGVVLHITLVAVRDRILDSDNSVGGFKCLRDTIAKWIGIDDGDSRIEWEYGQVRSGESEGTIVLIKWL